MSHELMDEKELSSYFAKKFAPATPVVVLGRSYKSDPECEARETLFDNWKDPCSSHQMCLDFSSLAVASVSRIMFVYSITSWGRCLDRGRVRGPGRGREVYMESVQPPKRPLGATRPRAQSELHGGPLEDQSHSSAFFSEGPLGATRSTLGR